MRDPKFRSGHSLSKAVEVGNLYLALPGSVAAVRETRKSTRQWQLLSLWNDAFGRPHLVKVEMADSSRSLLEGHIWWRLRWQTQAGYCYRHEGELPRKRQLVRVSTFLKEGGQLKKETKAMKGASEFQDWTIPWVLIIVGCHVECSLVSLRLSLTYSAFKVFFLLTIGFYFLIIIIPSVIISFVFVIVHLSLFFWFIAVPACRSCSLIRPA